MYFVTAAFARCVYSSGVEAAVSGGKPRLRCSSSFSDACARASSRLSSTTSSSHVIGTRWTFCRLHVYCSLPMPDGPFFFEAWDRATTRIRGRRRAGVGDGALEAVAGRGRPLRERARSRPAAHRARAGDPEIARVAGQVALRLAQQRRDAAQFCGQLRLVGSRERERVRPEFDHGVVRRSFVGRRVALSGPDRLVERGIAHPRLQDMDVEIEAVHLRANERVVDLLIDGPGVRLDRFQPASARSLSARRCAAFAIVRQRCSPARLQAAAAARMHDHSVNSCPDRSLVTAGRGVAVARALLGRAQAVNVCDPEWRIQIGIGRVMHHGSTSAMRRRSHGASGIA